MATDTGGNVQIDHIWGNMPMQPDDQRLDDDNSTDVLDPSLGDHIIATTSYNGFPGYTPEAPYLDTVANVAVPTLVGLTEAAATTALTNAGLVKGAVTTADNAGGATALNDGKIKSSSPAVGTVVNVRDTVTLVKYAYTP